MNETNALPILAKNESANFLFPVFIKLEKMRLLIIGGGPVALEKLSTVLKNAPATNIRLVAITILPAIKEVANAAAEMQWFERPYETADLEDTDIVLVAVNNLAQSALIYGEAKAKGLWVNVADTPDLCDFYLSSVVQKGHLKIAISTNGKSPILGNRLKEVLQETLPDQLTEILDNLQVIRSKLKGNFEEKVIRLNKITQVLVTNEASEKIQPWKRIVQWSLIIFASMLIGHFIFSYIPFAAAGTAISHLYSQLQPNFFLIVLAGFLAQLIDGSLGMGYGISSTTVLLSAGLNPAAISGSIHTAEMFASGASGYSHYRFGNVNKKLFRAIVIPGVIGSVAGAILLVRFGETHAGYIRPIMAAYTLVLGVKFIINAFRQKVPAKKFKHYSILAGAGGFLDSFGGGGWGPIVTSTLINRGRNPKYVIGTVSLTEFFVTLASAFSFFVMIGVSHWQVIIALILGSLLAAPLAAKLAGKMPKKTAYLLLGILVIIWSIRILIKIL